MGNKGFRKYLKNEAAGSRFSIDEEKLKREARYDGKLVLRTNTNYSAEEVAFQYKELCTEEQAFRAVKSVLETRPIYHKCDDTIRGHADEGAYLPTREQAPRAFFQLLQHDLCSWQGSSFAHDLSVPLTGGFFMATQRGNMSMLYL